MRRRNRRRNTYTSLIPTPAAGVIVLVLTLAMVYLWMDHSCTALGQQLKGLEQRLAVLRNERVRENNRWTQMKAPARLDQALLRHGVVMQLARPEQVVHMRSADPSAYPVREDWAHVEVGP